MKLNTKSIAFIGVSAALTAVCSQIALPLPLGVPMTLQTFSIALAGYLLGKRDGTLSTIVFILLGAAGAPVFAGFKGGISVLIGPTGGFLAGFILMALLCGIASDIKNKAAVILISLAGLACAHIFGLIWLIHVSGTSLKNAFLLASAPFIIKDIISMIIAYIIASRISEAVFKNKRS